MDLITRVAMPWLMDPGHPRQGYLFTVHSPFCSILRHRCACGSKCWANGIDADDAGDARMQTWWCGNAGDASGVSLQLPGWCWGCVMLGTACVRADFLLLHESALDGLPSHSVFQHPNFTYGERNGLGCLNFECPAGLPAELVWGSALENDHIVSKIRAPARN